MARLVQLLGLVFFLCIMGWGAWATLYDRQMHGLPSGNLPEVGSPVLPEELISALPYIGIAILLLGFVVALLPKANKSNPPATPRRAGDFDDGDPDRPLVDDAKIAAAAARYHAEQLVRQLNTPSFTSQPRNTGPVTFGRRNADR